GVSRGAASAGGATRARGGGRTGPVELSLRRALRVGGGSAGPPLRPGPLLALAAEAAPRPAPARPWTDAAGLVRPRLAAARGRGAAAQRHAQGDRAHGRGAPAPGDLRLRAGHRRALARGA